MSSSRLFHALSLALLFTAFGLFGQRALAAPQILALVATKGEATPMTCAGGECRAELSSFCLQQERPIPASGTAYRAIDPSDLTLVVEHADGTTVHLPAGDLLTLTAARTVTSVTATLDAAQVARLGAVELSVLVGEQVSLLPEPERDDAEPQTEADVALATTTLRKLGTRLVDNGDGRIAAARATNLLINALPGPGRAASSGPPEGAWAKATAWRPPADSGYHWAEHLIESCAARDWSAPMRHCLRQWHDLLMRELNHDYWKAVRTGT